MSSPKSLLHISALPRGAASESLQIATTFLDSYRDTHPEDRIDGWDVWDGSLPEFGPAAADRLLFSVPMWNACDPYILKQFIGPEFGRDFQSTYFNDWLAWTGITDMSEVRRHPTLSGDTDQARRSAHATARDTAKTF